MKRLAVCLALVCCPAALLAADPPPVVLPLAPAPPTPPPATVPTIQLGQVYAVQANVAVTIVASPDGIVEICPRKVPVTVDATFWPDTVSSVRDFAAPVQMVYLVKPKATGNCELIIVAGATVIRQPLIVGTPTPPKPPTPPAPTDPLTTSLQTAYAAEVSPDKAARLADLTAFYSGVIAAEKAQGTSTTVLQLATAIKGRADIITGAGGMPKLRAAVAAYVAGKMPATDGPMTEDLWQRAALYYADVAKALKGVK